MNLKGSRIRLLYNNMKLSIRMILIILFILASNIQLYTQWSYANFPFEGKINSIVIEGENIYAASDGEGIFISSDSGEHWTNKNNGLPNLFIKSLLIHRGIIYAGTMEGIAISKDKGDTWEVANESLPKQPIFAMTVGSDSRIFVGIWNEIYYSDDGSFWKPSYIPFPPFITMPIISMTSKEENIYATCYTDGFIVSEDNGITWSLITVKKIQRNGNTVEILDEIIPINKISNVRDCIIFSGGNEGSFYYYNELEPEKSSSLYNTKDIISFAERNDTIFAGTTNGSIIKIKVNRYNSYNFSERLVNKSIYSLILDKSYIYAGTDQGVWKLYYPDVTTEINNNGEIPADYVLEQNYPNPFNPETTIRFSIPKESFTSLVIYDILGNKISVIVNKLLRAGSYEYKWNGSNNPSGIYFCWMKAGHFSKTIKMIQIK